MWGKSYRHSMLVEERRGTNLWLIYQFSRNLFFIFKEKFCASLTAKKLFPSFKGEKGKIFLESRLYQTPQLYLGQTKLVRQELTLLKFFLLWNNFPITAQRIFSPFLLLGYALIFWQICLKTKSYFLFGQLGLINFYLKQKQSFSVWNFTENVSFISISFHEGISLITKHTKKAGLN